MTAGRNLLLKSLVVAVIAFATAAAFSAYLHPDMLLVYGDIMAFCAALIR